MGARHQDARDGPDHAALAHRAERRHPAVQGRSLAERRRDRHHRRRGPTPARRAAIPPTCRRRRLPERRGMAHRHARSHRADSEGSRRPRRWRRSLDRLHRRLGADRGSLSQGRRGQARAGRARRRAPPADVLDSGSGRRRSALRPARRSRHQQRELPQRVRGRQERRHPARWNGQAGQGRRARSASTCTITRRAPRPSIARASG